MQVDNGATLITAGTWSNTGTMNVQSGATLNLGGSFTTAGLGIFAPAPAGSFSRTGGTVNVTGTLDNTGSTLALDSRTGGWNVAGGTIIGGTITTSGGNVLTAVDSSNTLSGVTLDGTLDMSSVFAPKMTVTNGLTLNGTILLGGANGSDVATLTAQGTQAWSGTGSILFGGSDTTSLAISSGATLTLGAGLTLHGQSGEITGTFINQGTINVDLAGRTAGSTADEDLTLIGTGWINQGTLQVDNGGQRRLRDRRYLVQRRHDERATRWHARPGRLVQEQHPGHDQRRAGHGQHHRYPDQRWHARLDGFDRLVGPGGRHDQWRHDHDLRQRGADRPEYYERLERRHAGRHARAHDGRRTSWAPPSPAA